MPAVLVSNVGPDVTVDKIEEFFSFCGQITEVKSLGSGTFEVVFKLTKAVETAILLNDAELETSTISVATATSSTGPPLYESSGDVSIDAMAKTAVQNGTGYPDPDTEDISQEEKPKLAVLAQLLAAGYKISDKLIAKAIQIDQQQGISTRFKAFITNLDAKYIHSNDPDSVASKNLEKANIALGDLTSKLTTFANLRDVRNYLDKAAATHTGLRIHKFYKSVAKEIKDVHEEAFRLYALQKKEGEAKAVSASSVTSSTLATPVASAAYIENQEKHTA